MGLHRRPEPGPGRNLYTNPFSGVMGKRLSSVDSQDRPESLEGMSYKPRVKMGKLRLGEVRGQPKAPQLVSLPSTFLFLVGHRHEPP